MQNLQLDNPIEEKGSSFQVSKQSLKNIGITLLILTVVAILLVFVFFAPAWFAGKNEGGEKTITFSSSLITGKIQTTPDDLSQTIATLVKKGTAVAVTFSVENGNTSYEDRWEISQATLDGIQQTQDRVMLFRKTQSELEAKIDAYNTALDVVPCRAFALAIDVTEGFRDGFSFQKYFTDEDMKWLKDKHKKSSLFVFSIGYNPIPGFMSWENINPEDISSIEREAKAFFVEVPHALDSTKLFSQVHFIMNRMKEFKNSSIVIESDLLENTHNLSAYQENSRGFKKFVSKDWSIYHKTVLYESQSPACPEVIANVRVLLPAQTALGKQKSRYSWYSAVREYLSECYPEVTFKYNF